MNYNTYPVDITHCRQFFATILNTEIDYAEKHYSYMKMCSATNMARVTLQKMEHAPNQKKVPFDLQNCYVLMTGTTDYIAINMHRFKSKSSRCDFMIGSLSVIDRLWKIMRKIGYFNQTLAMVVKHYDAQLQSLKRWKKQHSK